MRNKNQKKFKTPLVVLSTASIHSAALAALVVGSVASLLCPLAYGRENVFDDQAQCNAEVGAARAACFKKLSSKLPRLAYGAFDIENARYISMLVNAYREAGIQGDVADRAAKWDQIVKGGFSLLNQGAPGGGFFELAQYYRRQGEEWKDIGKKYAKRCTDVGKFVANGNELPVSGLQRTLGAITAGMQEAAATRQPTPVPVQRPQNTASSSPPPERQAQARQPEQEPAAKPAITHPQSPELTGPPTSRQPEPTRPNTTTYTPRAVGSGGSETSHVGQSASVTTYTPRSFSPAGPDVKMASVMPPGYTPPVVNGTTRPTAAVAPAYKLPATVSAGSALSLSDSRSVLTQVNAARTGMVGVNNVVVPSGTVTVHPNGDLTLHASGARQYELRASGTIASFTTDGLSASFGADGRIRNFHASTVEIRHYANGMRVIIARLPDNSVAVSLGAHSGYLERVVSSGDRAFLQRTYSIGGTTTPTRTFKNYTYHEMTLTRYIPDFYYAPKFYGWAYYPWGAPIGYAWAWTGAPWFRRSGEYFTPYAAYPSGFAWLTDYILSQTLADGYEQRNEDADLTAGDATGNLAAQDITFSELGTPITSELKDALAEEVRQQLAYENAAASGAAAPDIGDLPSVLKPRHLFVVASGLDVTTVDEQTCALSAGDVLWLSAAPPEAASMADLRVASSKRADCPVGVQIAVSLQDLQEMHNSLRARLDAGLQELFAKQGTGDLPSAPETALAPPPRPVMADRPTIVDSNVAALLDAQRQEAKQTESGIVRTAFGSQPPDKQ